MSLRLGILENRSSASADRCQNVTRLADDELGVVGAPASMSGEPYASDSIQPIAGAADAPVAITVPPHCWRTKGIPWSTQPLHQPARI